MMLTKTRIYDSAFYNCQYMLRAGIRTTFDKFFKITFLSSGQDVTSLDSHFLSVVFGSLSFWENINCIYYQYPNHFVYLYQYILVPYSIFLSLCLRPVLMVIIPAETKDLCPLSLTFIN